MVAVFVSSSVARLRCANTAGWIEIVFGAESLGDLRHSVLAGGSDPLAVRPPQNYFVHFLCLRSTSVTHCTQTANLLYNSRM